MGNHRRELVSQRACEAVQNFMSGTTLCEIDELWEDQLFAPVFEIRSQLAVSGSVTHFQGYLDQVDWRGTLLEVARVLRVFEAALSWLFDPTSQFRPGAERVDRLRRLLRLGRPTSGLMMGKLLAGLKVAVVEDPLLVGINSIRPAFSGSILTA